MPEYGKNGNTLNLEHLVFKCNNASSWSAEYVLAAGELGVELDTKKVKLGDGTTTWGSLDYYTDPVISGVVETLTGRVTTAEGTLTALGGRMDTAEGNITSQGTRLDTAESTITSQGTRLTTAEGDIDAVEGRMDTAEADIDALEAKDIAHETRMGNLETKDSEQDGRLSALEGITIISANPFRE